VDDGLRARRLAEGRASTGARSASERPACATNPAPAFRGVDRKLRRPRHRATIRYLNFTRNDEEANVKTLFRIAALAASALIAAAPATAQTADPTQRFANGRDWTSASVEERRAFLFGIANAISVGVGWDERHVPAGQTTFARRAGAGLSGISLGETMRRVDAWYAANPGKLETPVVAVMWLDIAKPKLKPAK
jgi:hypothetical protein